MKSFTLVLPNGTISKVDSSQPDLFFALKGGLNRFGIVTSAVYVTHEQPDLIYVSTERPKYVYMGSLLYGRRTGRLQLLLP